MKHVLLASAGWLLLALPLAAQNTTESPLPAPPPQSPPVAARIPPQPLNGFVELGGNYHALTDGFGIWNGGYLRTVVASRSHTFTGEIAGQREFGDTGIFLSAGDSFTFNPDWYGSLSLGTSVGGFFYPRVRVDAFMNRKLLERRQLIINFGSGYYAAKDVHRDYSASTGMAYYFSTPWIFETGARFTVSTPGNVFAPSGFVAITQGRHNRHYLVARAGFAHEAYEIVGPGTVLTDFVSQEASLTWRKWLGETWGINAVGEYYHNKNYERGGIIFGIFKDF